MRFIETVSGDYVAVDTIAKITDVVDIKFPSVTDYGLRHEASGIRFGIITKRGENYEAKMPRAEFDKLVRGV